MRLADFHNFVIHEFGPEQGPWLLHSHVLMGYGKTPTDLLEDGVEPRDIWWALCKEFDVPEERWYGPDE
ncbi:MAG: DUF3046 domain-containing protein [Corynebacterium sp.]|uniref:DUF3046 domain-containing protein n=1 Tax=Corynebacterium sp. TaxID=1720 RepID=UPI0026DCB08F|nr:DUF3046 domain-containing protein [Corynebacterium sp.]MDO5029232.1 DUF3046 domain-containing protein [Corynebacterium sp.]